MCFIHKSFAEYNKFSQVKNSIVELNWENPHPHKQTATIKQIVKKYTQRAPKNDVYVYRESIKWMGGNKDQNWTHGKYLLFFKPTTTIFYFIE